MDYNIYIHSVGSGSTVKPTEPRSMGTNTKPLQVKEEESGGGVDIGGKIRQVGGFIQNPDSAFGMARSAVFSKAGVVGVAIAVAYQVSNKVAGTVIDLNAMTTGDYGMQHAFNEFHSMTRYFTNPISTLISDTKQMILIQQENARKQLQAQLLGDSQLNTYYGKKV